MEEHEKCGESRAEKLSNLLATHRAEIRNYWQRAQMFAGHLATGLCEYLGLPTTYKVPDGREEEWVKLYNWSPDKGLSKPSVMWPGLDSMSNDLFLHFALAVTVEEGPGIIPKKVMWMPVAVKPLRNGFALCYGPDLSKKLELTGESTGNVVFFEAYLKLIEESLTSSIYDAQPTSAKIGFV